MSVPENRLNLTITPPGEAPGAKQYTQEEWAQLTEEQKLQHQRDAIAAQVEQPQSIDLEQVWRDRWDAEKQRQWDSTLSPAPTAAAAAPVAVDISPEALARSADAAAQNLPLAPKLASPLESTSEAVRTRASVQQAAIESTPAIAEGMARLLGFKDASEARDRLSRGDFTLSDAMKIGDVVGNIGTALGRKQAEDAGLPTDIAEKIATGAGLAGMLWPPGAAGKAVSTLRKTNDMVHYAYLQFLLSNPVTHSANILGTAATTAAMYPERFVAEWVNRIFFQNPQGVARGETWAMMRAGGEAATNGVRLLGKAIAKGEQPFPSALVGTSRIETRFDISAQHFGIDPNSPIGKLMDTVGALMPTRLMMGEDAFYKGFIYTSEIPALALREAMSEGLTGAALVARAEALRVAPTAAIINAAQDAAVLRTLNAPLGEIGQAAMNLRNATPGASFMFAFLQTPVNSFKWAWQRTPGLSMISLQNWKDIAEGGAARDLAISRMAIGNVVGAAVAWQVLQGNITGALPTGSNKNLNRDAKQLGIVPFTIRAGDESYGYKRVDPVGQYISSIATAVEIYSQISNRDPQAFSWEDFSIAAGLAGSRIAMDTPQLQNLTNILDAIAKPDASGMKVLRGLASGLVPGVLHQATRSGVPGISDPHPEIRELDTILDAVKAQIPWMVTGVAPELHPITGDVLVRPAGWGPDVLSPIFVTRRVNSKVLQEIVSNQMDFPEPSKTMYGKDVNPWSLDPTQKPPGVELTQPEYFRLKMLATREVRDGEGRTMIQRMSAVISSDEYQAQQGGPSGGREARLKEIYHLYYKNARLELLKEDQKLADAVDKVRQDKIRRLMPSGSGNSVPTIPFKIGG